MYAKRLIFLILLWSITIIGYSQNFNYSYTDPCTGVLKTIQVPSNGITVSYYGQFRTFNADDFNNGAFSSWMQTVYAGYGNNNPCASIVGLPVAVNIAQNTAITFIGIVNSLSALSDMAEAASGGSTNLLSGLGSVQTSSEKKDEKKGNGAGSSANGESTNNGTPNSQGSTTSSNGQANSQGQPAQPSVTGAGSTPNQPATPQTGSEPNSTPGSSPTSGSTANPSTGSTAGSSSASGSTTDGSTSSTPGSSPTSGSTANPSTGSNGSGSSSSSTPGSTATNGSGSSSTPGSTNSGNNTTSDASKPTNPTSDAPKTEAGAPTTEASAPKTNVLGGSVNSIIGATSNSGAKSASNKNGNRPSILASSDFVGFNFKNSDVTVGAKVTGGYSSMRWDGKRAHGIMADYTTALKGPNITGFYAFMKKKRIDLISTTLTLGFDARTSVYGTLAVGQLYSFKKPKKLKAIWMLTASYGNVYGESFVGTAGIAGCMYDLKISKRIDIKLLGLYVYAPYVSYYNDILLKSPHVVLPIIGTNIAITKRFKININGGGAWAIKENALNYTIMMGTRLAL
jgi:hypothetical protein